ncbi:hypothetical protein J6590_072465, partial [Homalodisca vitripennis]
MLILILSSLHQGGGTSSSSRCSRAALVFTEKRDTFTETRHWHRGRKKFREEPSREQIVNDHGRT